MKRLITGPSKSGKSLWAESMLAQSDNKLGYFATLPNVQCFKKTISKHISQRGDLYNTYESSYNIDEDMEKLSDFFKEGTTVLIDGLANYIWYSVIYDGVLNKQMSNYLYDMLSQVLSPHSNKWIIVDVDPATLDNDIAPVLSETLYLYQSMLLEKCGAEYYNILDHDAING